MKGWSNKINRILEYFECTKTELEQNTGVGNGYIHDVERGKNKNPSKLINGLVNFYGINPNWLLDKDETMLIKEASGSTKDTITEAISGLIQNDTAPQFSEHKELLDAHSERIQELEAHQQRMQDELTRLMELYSSKDTGLPPSPSEYRIKGGTESETHQSVPAYGSDDEDELTERLPLALNLAAGIPREACDSGDTVAVPNRFLKKGHNYCVAKIAGTSMTEAGIQDGSHVLLEYSNEPKAGAIMVVKYGANTTLKLLHLTEGGTWELRYQDGSGAKVELKDYEWEVQGLFVRVLKP